jgi:hypothetical protein
MKGKIAVSDTSRELTAERLREVLNYNPGTGVFTWRVQTGRRAPVGAIAGCITWYGYIAIKIDCCRHLAHRLAWFYVTGAWPKDQIDHINGNRSDKQTVQSP